MTDAVVDIRAVVVDLPHAVVARSTVVGALWLANAADGTLEQVGLGACTERGWTPVKWYVARVAENGKCEQIQFNHQDQRDHE